MTGKLITVFFLHFAPKLSSSPATKLGYKAWSNVQKGFHNQPFDPYVMPLPTELLSL